MPSNSPDYNPELLRGNTESLLLFLINEHEHTYGYRLIKEIEKRSRGFFHFKEGTVYPALRKLENDGLIKGEWRQLPNGQDRRYYRITAKGKEALKQRLAMWHNFTSAMNLIFKPVGG
jgi:PadR family transcriptional regulator PadR